MIGKRQIKSSQCVKGQLKLLNCKKDNLGHWNLTHITKLWEKTQMPLYTCSSSSFWNMSSSSFFIFFILLYIHFSFPSIHSLNLTIIVIIEIDHPPPSLSRFFPVPRFPLSFTIPTSSAECTTARLGNDGVMLEEQWVSFFPSILILFFFFIFSSSLLISH